MVALILTMAAGIVLGMGMPTTPAYIIMVSLLVPALIKLGVVQAGGAYVRLLLRHSLGHHTAGRARGLRRVGPRQINMWKTGIAAVKVGAAGFIVPFMFVYEPALLMIGDWPTIIWRFAVSCIGIALLAGGLHGYFLKPMPNWQRAVSVAAALMLVVPTVMADVVGFGLMALVIAAQYFAEPDAKLASVGAAAVERAPPAYPE